MTPDPEPGNPEPERPKVLVPPLSAEPIVQIRPSERPIADIQRVVGATVDGISGPETISKIKAWQAAHWLDADGEWGVASDGTAFPPTGSVHGVDYSFARPDPALLAQRGVKIAARYLFQLTYSQGTSKGISRAEYDALTAQGIDVHYSYEEDPTLPIEGFAVGVAQAKAAEAHRLREGLPEKRIYFNVDYNAPAAKFPAILDGLRGAASVVGWERTGLYAGYYVLRAAFDAGVISGGWQTYGWSQDAAKRTLWDPRAELQQWANGQWGETVDFTRAVVPLREEKVS